MLHHDDLLYLLASLPVQENAYNNDSSEVGEEMGDNPVAATPVPALQEVDEGGQELVLGGAVVLLEGPPPPDFLLGALDDSVMVVPAQQEPGLVHVWAILPQVGQLVQHVDVLSLFELVEFQDRDVVFQDPYRCYF